MTLRFIIKLDLMMLLLIYGLICVTLFHGLRYGRCFSVLRNAKMHFGYNNRKAGCFMDEVNFEHVTDEKDLGVLISEDLKSEKQCSSAVSKANRVLGMIKRNFLDRSKETVLLLYKSLARPHLEYCCQVCPHYSTDKKLLEGVQHRATKLINGTENLHYKERLRLLGLMSLETCRVRGDLIEVFTFINLMQIYFLNMIRVTEEAILRNCTKDEVDLILESLCLEIG